MLTSRGLPSDSTNVLQAEPGKLDIKRRKPSILFWLTKSIQTSEYDQIMDFLCGFSVIGDVIQKVQCHHDLIKAHAVRLTTFIRQRATLKLIGMVTDKNQYTHTDVKVIHKNSFKPSLTRVCPADNKQAVS